MSECVLLGDVVVELTEISASAEVSLSPIVSNVSIANGPPGKPGAPGGETLSVTGLNVSGGAIAAGQAVAMAPAGVGFVLADFSDLDRRGVGVVRIGGAAGAELEVVLLGVCEVADWIVSTEGNWLPPNTRLWLASGGSMTTSPTAVAGQYHQSLGTVLAPQKLIVHPGGVLIMSE